MRVPIAVVLIALGAASVTAARAADLPAGRYYSAGAVGIGERSAPVVVYGYQPGVVVRAYWSAPWHNHHYYPATGEKPEIGRDEDFSAPSDPSEPPATFKRSWSNAAAFVSVRPRVTARGRDRQPQAEPRLPPLK